MLSLLLEGSSAPYFFGYMGAAFALVFASTCSHRSRPQRLPCLVLARADELTQGRGGADARVLSCRPRRRVRHRQERRWCRFHGRVEAGARDALDHPRDYGWCHRYVFHSNALAGTVACWTLASRMLGLLIKDLVAWSRYLRPHRRCHRKWRHPKYWADWVLRQGWLCALRLRHGRWP